MSIVSINKSLPLSLSVTSRGACFSHKRRASQSYKGTSVLGLKHHHGTSVLAGHFNPMRRAVSHTRLPQSKMEAPLWNTSPSIEAPQGSSVHDRFSTFTLVPRKHYTSYALTQDNVMKCFSVL